MPLKIKETILGFSIAIIFVFFVVFGIKAFYKEPKQEDFCARGTYVDVVYTKGYYPEPYPARFKEPAENACAKANSEYEKFRKDCITKKADVEFEYDENNCQWLILKIFGNSSNKTSMHNCSSGTVKKIITENLSILMVFLTDIYVACSRLQVYSTLFF